MSDSPLFTGIFIGAIAGILATAKFCSNRNTKENENLKRELESGIQKNKTIFTAKEKYYKDLEAQFHIGYGNGRKWLVKLISEATMKLEEDLSFDILPANYGSKPSNDIRFVKRERVFWMEKAKTLEYQIETLKEYFPFIDDYSDSIFEENYDFNHYTSPDNLKDTDQALRFLSPAEYKNLPAQERNQLALERYLNGKQSPQTIGKWYEMYVGFLYEKKGWTVEYHGLNEGLQDLGRDLICTSPNKDKVLVIQAKCWAKHKPIRERHVFQLFGTTQLLKKSHHTTKSKSQVFEMQIVTSSELSDVAKKAADSLGISVWSNLKLDKNFPLIKCNINASTKEKIYHLPFDQQYEKTKISKNKGEFFALTCAEAEAAGFRRAFKFMAKASS